MSSGLVPVIEDQLQFSGVYRRASSSLIQVTILMRSTGSMKVEEGSGSGLRVKGDVAYRRELALHMMALKYTSI